MEYQDMTKEQLINELENLHRRVSELEASEAIFKETERLLRESEERYRSIVEQIDLGISVIDSDHNIIMSNKTIGKWYDKPASELRGKKCYEMFRGIQSVCPNCHGVQAMTTGMAAESESTGLRMDGARANVRVQCFPTFRPDGVVTGFIEVIEDITERKKVQEELRESEERYRAVFDNASVGIDLVDRDGRFVQVNNALTNMLGHTDRELLGLRVSDITHPDDRKISEQRLESIMRGDMSTYRLEKRFIKKDGSTMWGDLSVSAIRNGGGEHIATLGVIADITDRKKAEIDLRESRRILQNVLDTIPAAVFWKDRDSVYLGANRVLLKAVGMNSSLELLGKTDYDLPWEKDQADYFREYDRKVMESGIPEYDIIEPQTEADGTVAWVKTNKIPLRDQEGTIVGILGTYEDITERKRAEESLREANEVFYTFADQLPASVFIKDHSGHVQYINKYMRQEFDSERWIGRDASEYFPPEVATAVLADDKRAFSDGPIVREQWIPDKKGVKRLWETRRFPIHREGKPPLLGGVSIDITERKIADDKLKASLGEKEILLREIHHRVKNNLQLITSLLRLQLRQIKNKDESLVNIFENVQSRIKTMALVHEALYRSENLELIDMSQYIQGIVVGLRAASPRGTQEVGIKTDVKNISLGINAALACGLIVNELVTNSLKHAFPGGREGEIVVILKPVDGEEFQLTVHDNGIGMPEHVDLQQPESLGLDLVANLTRQLDGIIEFATGEGTEFRIRFVEQTSKSGSH